MTPHAPAGAVPGRALRRSLLGLLPRLVALALGLLMLLAGHPDVAIAEVERPDGQFDVAVVEHLRVKVPSEARAAWLEAERGSWEPWLARHAGYLGRDLLWDGEREEGTLLIRWASREQWQSIPEAEVEAVQERFEELARRATGVAQGNPFPLVYEGELLPP